MSVNSIIEFSFELFVILEQIVNIMKGYQIFCLSIIALFLLGCESEPTTPARDSISILLNKDPERLNPVYDSRAVAREVYQYMYLPLADYHPETLELYPIIIDDIPKSGVEADGEIKYNIQIKENASWSDGTPITGDDYLFTVKAVALQESSPRSWKPYMQVFKSIEVDESDRKKLVIGMDADYMLSLETATTIFLLPKHSYTNANILDGLSLEQCKSITKESHPELETFLAEFNDPKHYKAEINNGPYNLVNWQTDQYLKIQEKENYWAGDGGENPFLQSTIPTMEFKIMEDEMTAVTAFKDGGIDLIRGLSADNFSKLQEEKKEAGFLSSPSSRYYYIAINNKHPILGDKDVRKALNQLVDLDGMLENIESGYGTKLTGPIHPKQNYYDANLSSDLFRPENAKQLLEKEGWSDTNSDGTIDKVIEGKKEELELDLLITGSPLGKKVALVFQSEAKKVGIKINIVPKDIRRMRAENLYTYNYDLAALAEGQDVAPNDPFPRWHSENIKERGSNISGYSSTVADSLIELIRTTRKVDERSKYFKEFHQLIYEDQPVIFLYSPTEKIVLNGDFEGTATAKRPGYLANTFNVKSR